MATREQLHRRVDELSDPEVEAARIVLIDEVAPETSVGAILERHGEQQATDAEFNHHFGSLSSDGEG